MHVSLNLCVFPLQRTAWFPPSYGRKLWPYRGPWNLTMPVVKVTFPDSMGQLLLLHLSPLTSMSFLRHLEERLWSSWSWDCPPGTLMAVHSWRLRVPLTECSQLCSHDTVLPHFVLCLLIGPLTRNVGSAGAEQCPFCSFLCPQLPGLHWCPDVWFIASFNKYERNHSINFCFEVKESVTLGLNRVWTCANMVAACSMWLPELKWTKIK